jgi:hypothetical protein
MLAEMRNHLHTHNGADDVRAGSVVRAEYVGTARHPWLRVPMARYRVTTLQGQHIGVFWARDLKPQLAH